jgi:hypothetical protein
LKIYFIIYWNFLYLIFVSGKAEDDLVLETVMMVGAGATDEACAKLFCKADILTLLIELLKSKAT